MSTQGDQRQAPSTEDQVFRGVLRALGVAAAVIALLVLVAWLVIGAVSADDGLDCSINNMQTGATDDCG